MKYLKNGQECEVVTEFDGGFVVKPIYERDGEPFEGDQKVVNAVFDSPPMERLNKDVAGKQSERRELSKQLDELRAEIRAATTERQKLLDSIKQVPALQRIDDFICKRFTHIVQEDYGRYSIVAVDSDEFRCADSRYDRDFKLITLFGQTKGDLAFRINQYSGGSGRDCQCWLCFSEQEAKDLIVQKINEKLKEGPASRGCWFDSYEKSLTSLGLPVPEVITKHLKANRLNSAAKAKIKAAQELDKANAEFEKVSAEIGDPK